MTILSEKDPENQLNESENIRTDILNTGKITDNDEGKILSIMANAPDYICIVDRTGRIIYINRTVKDIKKDEAIGKTIFDFTQKEYHNYLRESLENVFIHGHANDLITEGFGPGGRIVKYRTRFDSITRKEQIEEAVLIVTDISSREKAEELFLESEEMFKRFIDHSMIGFYITQNHHIKYCNNRLAEIFGYNNSTELIGMHVHKLVAKESWAVVDFEVKQRESGKKNSSRYEFKGTKKDGSLFDAEVLGYLNEFKNQPAKMGTLIDITKRKSVERELREKNEFNLALFNHNPIQTIVVNKNGKIINYNLAKMESGDDLPVLGEQMYKDYAGHHSIDMYSELMKCINCSKIKEFPELKYRDKFLSISISPFPGGAVITSEDITEYKLAVDALRESEVKFRTFFENVNDAVYIHDEKGKILEVNHGACLQLGYSRDDLLKMNVKDLVSPGKVAFIQESRKLLFKNGELFYESIHRRRDMSEIPVEINTRLIDYKGSKVALGLVRDISRRKNAEIALKNSFDKLKEAQHFAKMGNWKYSILDNKIECSDEIFNIFERELSRPEPTVEEVRDYVHPEDRLSVEEKIKDQLSSCDENATKCEYRIQFKDGEVKSIEHICKKVFDDDGNITHFYGTIQDITERIRAEEDKRRLEEQLIQAQKMESIGRLAGGIAHDFNNILTGIMGFAELLKLKYNDTGTVEGNAAEIIIKGTERAANLTQQLLGFARGGKYNPVPLNINKLIKENIRVSEKIFEMNIKVKYDFESDIKNIEADNNQINQVLTNLIINSKDAMPNGGELLFRTENVHHDITFIRSRPEFKPGQYVMISVTDTGIGMTKEVRDQIFEPFYTTKGLGKGTGLGLATVYGIIKNHNGFIYCSSESGKGATFTLYFPVSERDSAEETKRNRTIVKGHATVLIVDDEDHVRKIAIKQLENLGYNAIVACDGLEAIDVYMNKKDKIDIVLLDMIMPNMAGFETYLKLKKIEPDIKVLLMSGYSQDEKATEILDEGVLGFIQKPFKLQELSKIIDKALRE